MTIGTKSHHPGLGRNWFREYERQAAALCGFADGAFGVWREDFVECENRLYFGSTAGTGTFSKAIGELELTSGATASSYRECFWDNAAGSTPDLIIPGGSGGEWAIYCRMRITDLDDQTRTTFGVRDSSGAAFIRLGVVGSASATNFIVDGDTADIDSGDADDASWHDWLVTRKGTTTSLFIDGVLKGTGNVFPASDSGPHAIASNGSTAAARKIGLQFAGAIFPRQVT